MLYEIKNNYYILVENKYVKVDFVIKNGNVEVVATKNTIEKDNNIIAKPINFNDEFKKKIKKQQEKPSYFDSKKYKVSDSMMDKNK